MAEASTTHAASSSACEPKPLVQHGHVSDREMTATTLTADIPAPLPPLEVPKPKVLLESSALNATQLREKKHKKKFTIKKFEKKLELLDRQIKKFNEAEVTLDEMASGSSAYMKEDLLKRKFVATWQKLCELQGIPDDLVIEDHDSSSYSGTPYPEVNRRVQRLLRFDEFPDHFDVCQLIERCNKKHNLGISNEEKVLLSRKVFKEVGQILKKSRHRDFIAHFGSHLTDKVKTVEDPALQDSTLLEQLKESLKEGEKKLNEMVENFVVKQELEYDMGKSPDGDSCSENENEEEEESGVVGEGVTEDDEVGGIDKEIEMEAEAAAAGEMDSISEEGTPEPLAEGANGKRGDGEYTPDSTVPVDPSGDADVTSSFLTTTPREADLSNSSSIDVEVCSQIDEQLEQLPVSDSATRPPPVSPVHTQVIYVSDDDHVVVISSDED